MEVKRRKDPEQIKKDIAAKAKELFSQRGYAATSMEDICTITGRSKGSIYYHFKNKEELFLYLIKQNMNEWITTWYNTEKQYETSTAKLYGLAQHFVEDFENPLMKTVDEFISSQVVSQEGLENILELTRAPYGMYEEILREGMENGEFQQENSRDMMYILNGLLGGLGTLYYETDIEEIKRLYKKAIDVLLYGISVKRS
ncbi:TetR family transcriptional regulator C-terminal domain-containing protein [Microbacteriaceae bacterium 4G12]